MTMHSQPIGPTYSNAASYRAEIHALWSEITDADIADIMDEADLAACLRVSYGLDAAQAKIEVADFLAQSRELRV